MPVGTLQHIPECDGVGAMDLPDAALPGGMGKRLTLS